MKKKEKKFLKNLEIKTNFITFVEYIKNILWKMDGKKGKKVLKKFGRLNKLYYLCRIYEKHLSKVKDKTKKKSS